MNYNEILANALQLNTVDLAMLKTSIAREIHRRFNGIRGASDEPPAPQKLEDHQPRGEDYGRH